MRYRPQMILIVVLVTVAVASAALLTTYLRSRVEMRSEIERQALSLALTAAAQIDPEDNARAFHGKKFDDPDYRKVEVELPRLRDIWRTAGVNVR